MSKYDDETIRKALELCDDIGPTAAAERIGVPKSTVFNWWQTKSAAKSDPPRQAEADGTDKIRIASLETELQELREQKASADLESPEGLWRFTESQNAKRIEKSESRRFHNVDLGSTFVAIAMISDQHISGGEVDLKRMREDAELIRDTPNMFCMLGGDLINNAITHRSSIIMSGTNPTQEWTLAGHYLNILKSKVIGLIGGNHDLEWSVKMAGVDPIHWLACERNLKYVPDELRLTALVGRQEYRICMRHKYSWGSRMNQGHAIRRMWEYTDWDFQIGVLCHHHEVSVDTFRRHGRDRMAIRPGSYQISSGYSRQNGFSDAIPACPTVILHPDQHAFDGFCDVRRAAKYLKAMNAAA